MRLKSLEIKGFKSFADQTVIHFGDDVIGIVGPNGCGKSNIVDAIRWVLGEQRTKELRSDKMASVIFNGTKKRKPGGMAQVSMSFENTRNLLPTEYQTVTITRILYRTGESEYRLNDVPCRLKDISTLLMDTGIGSDSYAIIALGMVDDILSDRENSRRRLLEQASGISKYKVRKREALGKLQSTSADLERVEDLLFEIDGNLKTLEKQAKRARKYLEIKAHYKELSIELAVFRLSHFKTAYKEVTQQLEQEEDRLRGLEAQLAQAEAQLEGEKKANLDKEQALSQRQRELNKLVADIRSLENERQMLQQKKQFIAQDLQKAERGAQQAEERLGQLGQEIDFYRQESNAEKRVEYRLESELAQAEEELEAVRGGHGKLKSDLDAFLKLRQQLDKEMFELDKHRAVNAGQLDNLQRELSRSREDIERRQGEIGQYRQQQERLHEQRRLLEAQLDELQAREHKRRRDLEQVEARSEQINQQIAQTNRKLDAKRNEYKLTKSLVDNLEGFPESIKFLSKHNKWNKRAPLLSDLIYCNEHYRVAIENYLEPYLNFYVVQDAAEAYEAIHLLTDAQKGKANFFLLNAFDDYEPKTALRPDAIPAIELVQVDKHYEKLCAYLLQGVYITDSDKLPEGAHEAGLTLLSRSGSFVRKTHSVSGGSVGLFEGKRIGRKKNLEVLSEAIAELEKEGEALSQQFYELKAQHKALKSEDLRGNIQDAERQLNRIGQELASVQTRLENFEGYLKENELRQSGAHERMAQIQDANAELDGRLAALRQELDKANAQIARADGSYRQVAERLNEASQQYNQKNIDFIKQQNKINALQRELSFREKQLADTQQAIERHRQQWQQNEAEAQLVEGSLGEAEQRLQALYTERQGFEALLTEAEQAYYQSRSGIHALEEQVRKTQRQRQDGQSLINSLKDRYNDIKLQLTSVGERLRAEFGLSINDLINKDPNPAYTRADLEDNSEKLKKRLDNYGEVNPMAVEAYDEMKARYDTIVQQRDDILSAKNALLETIQEIEVTATGKFMEAFNQVRDNFQSVFRSLFTEEDTCDLLLDNPEDPLESGIKITARPKGKRPQTIDQLSGGEKTLTATALLFSLYLLKPAPFCVFDEVDAPLDDANIEKFNRIIKRFSDRSQFIIVTHNKATMAAVDVTYGVSMQETGVSTVVPVDFRAFGHQTSDEILGAN